MKNSILFLLALLLLLQTCRKGQERSSTSSPVSWAKPQEQKDQDTVTVTKIVQLVKVQKVFVPQVARKDSYKAFVLNSKDIAVVAVLDTSNGKPGLMIDSLSFHNEQKITHTEDKRGNVSVSVINSNPYFHTADVNSYTFKVKQPSRWSIGPMVGVGASPYGVTPVLGVGVVFRLNR